MNHAVDFVPTQYTRDEGSIADVSKNEVGRLRRQTL
jgi:hypothetical protein